MDNLRETFYLLLTAWAMYTLGEIHKHTHEAVNVCSGETVYLEDGSRAQNP